MYKKNIAVVFGGASSEHKISCMSAYFILNNIRSDKYNIIPIGITEKGDWFLFNGEYEEILNFKWQDNKNNKRIILTPESNTSGALLIEGNTFTYVNIDVIFPILHGKNGEDGTIQGLIELSGIPLAGCKIGASVICMDKVYFNMILEFENIKQAKFTWVYKHQIEKDIDSCIQHIENNFSKSYPLFVKPSKGGSSVGITKANNCNELKSSLKTAVNEDDKVLIEQAINGKEVECAVLGNSEDLIVSTVGEIDSGSEFYDYDSKYINDTSKLYIPARINEDTINEIRNIAKKVYKLVGCSGFARIDFFVTDDNQIYFNEINTIPGFTKISMYPKLMQHFGLSAEDLIDKIIELAFE